MSSPAVPPEQNEPKLNPEPRTPNPALQNEPKSATDHGPRTTDSAPAVVLYSRTYNNIRFNDDLTISIPTAPPQRVSIAKRTQSDGQPAYYFVVSDISPVRTEPLVRTAPNHIAIFWDCSLSRSTTDLSRELSLIDTLAKEFKRTQIDVIRFSDKPQPCKTFTIGNQGNPAEIGAFLKATVYDGGTDLSALKIPAGCDFAILFTDGLSNLGPIPDKFAAPVFVVTADSRANHTALQTIAIRSRGNYINLNRYDNDAANWMIGASPVFASVQVVDGKVAELTPSDPQITTGRATIAGQLLSDSATLKLTYGHFVPGGVSHTIELKQSDAVEGRLIPRAWAQRRIAELSMDEKKNHDAILDLGREFGIVTPTTSLLVLETLQQYMQYKITPPRSRADMYAAYVKHVEENTKAEELRKSAKIDNVLAQWAARVRWWERQYEYPAEFKYGAQGLVKVGAGSLEVGNPTTRPVIINGQEMAPLPIRIPRPAYSGTPRSLPPGLVRNSEQPADTVITGIREGFGADPENSPANFGPPSAFIAGKKSVFEATRSNAASIQIKPWDPETPYLIRLRLAKPEDAYKVYLNERKESASPAFYLDCANFFIEKKQRDIGIRILTNIAELELDSPALLRVAAYRLSQIGEYDLAITLFEKVLALRPEEPQSHRDLALALIARGEKLDQGSLTPLNDYIRALGLLHHVVMHDWDRFPGIEVIALMEANRLMARMDKLPRSRELAFPFDQRIVKLLDCEVRVVLTWDSDLTDMDLWVTEPSGEKCVYNHNRTTIGGLLSNDFTQGYGPEEYCLRKAMKGNYHVQANFYGSRQQSLSGPTTLQAEIITNFGRPNEKRQAITLRLEKARDIVDVGTVAIE